MQNLNPLLNRKDFTKQRRALSFAQRKRFGNQATRQLNHLHLSRTFKKVGIYLDDFGELPTSALFLWLKKHNKSVYLPVVCGSSLKFRKVSHIDRQRMARHALGMREPKKGHCISAEQLDVLVMPLVIVDKQGNRTGMGGGFYDRTLAKKTQQRRIKQKPLCVGWAYDFQVVERLTANTWDVPIQRLITPSQVYYFST